MCQRKLSVSTGDVKGYLHNFIFKKSALIVFNTILYISYIIFHIIESLAIHGCHRLTVSPSYLLLSPLFLKQGPVASEVENVNSYSYKNLYLYLQELCIESSII